MPFLRPGHVVATLPLLLSKAVPNARLCRFGLLTLFSVSAAHSAQARPPKAARPFKAVGVKAWTSGSQTFIRARPGAAVPPVAKVARHTPLFVWGKYNGWYRVETHDHIFGWVFNPYLSSPDLVKVREMPRAKAQVASNRTAHQTMYGTPAVLKKHFVTYRAKGALVGLQKQGVYLAAAPKSSKPKTLIAKSSKSASTAAIPAAKTRLASARLASAPRVRNRVLIAEPIPRAFTPRSAAKTVQNSPIPASESPVLPSLSSQFGGVEASAAPRALETQKIAGSSRTLTPSARRLARAASEIASRPAPIVASAPLISVPAAMMPAAPRAVAASKPKTAKKAVVKAKSRSRVASRKARQRQQLRAQMGLSPAAVPATIIAPVSPAELMKAREEYLNARKARFGTLAPAPAQQLPAETPVIGLAPLPAPSGPLGGAPQNLAPAAPARFAPTSFEGEIEALPPLANDGSHPLSALLNDPRIVALAQLTPNSAATPTPKTKIAARGGSPLQRATAMRGGSPRDRFGSGMANQALSYRGMPYIRGAASPKRGFDCSGLVYFLLRQRGYNPPRTAAGYRNWGQSVPRGGLQSGDLVLFANTYKRGISHIGVYLGEGKFVHAATSGTGVRVSSLNERYYAGKYFGARRVK